MSVNSTNPSEFFGGTWERWCKGKVPVGVDEKQQDFGEVEQTGGEYYHTITVDELPATTIINESGPISVGTSSSTVKSKTDSAEKFSVMQPYITCYMWKRTA